MGEGYIKGTDFENSVWLEKTLTIDVPEGKEQFMLMLQGDSNQGNDRVYIDNFKMEGTLTSVATAAPTSAPTASAGVTTAPTSAPTVAPTAAPVPSNGWEPVYEDDFESGQGLFMGSGIRFNLFSYPANEGWSLRIKKKSALKTQWIDVSNYSQISISFWMYADNMENGDDFFFRARFDGQSSF